MVNTEFSENEMEQKILEAAKKVFILKGMEGARMQEIADEAGINKSLLHYYFRSKEKLFDKIFQHTISTIFPQISEIFSGEMSLFETIRIFTKKYIQFLSENPFLPLFILHEIQHNPTRVKDIIKTISSNGKLMFAKVEEAKQKNLIINDIQAVDILINVISLCIFPIASSPILKLTFFQSDNTKFAEFIEKRKTDVAEFVINAIKI